MSLNKVRGVFVSILLLRLVYLLSVTIQAPLGSESLRSNLTRKVLMIFFMLKKQHIVHESLWFFFASSLHTHPAHTSGNMHPPYVVLQIGLCHCSIMALLASKFLFWMLRTGSSVKLLPHSWQRSVVISLSMYTINWYDENQFHPKLLLFISNYAFVANFNNKVNCTVAKMRQL